MEKHYFFLVLNTRTYETHYRHGAYKNKEDIQKYLKNDEKLVKTWIVVEDE